MTNLANGSPPKTMPRRESQAARQATKTPIFHFAGITRRNLAAMIFIRSPDGGKSFGLSAMPA